MKVKYIMLTILSLVMICFLLPILFTKKFKVAETSSKIEDEILNESERNLITNQYDYKNYKEINLLKSSTGEIIKLNLDEYLYGVVASEMPASYEAEALKAQAIVARTYTIYKIINGKKHENADICDNSSCCQAWISKEDRLAKWNEAERQSNWLKIVEAVNSTQGKVITYNGSVINAFFHANSGGETEIVSNVWGGTDYPYLQSVETSRRRFISSI